MKILVLTKNHPVEIVDVVNRIRNRFFNDKLKFFCDSPQLVAWELEEKKGIPYTYAFFPAIKTFEKNKDIIANAVDVFITVGTTDRKSETWYDVIVGLDNFEIDNYSKFDTSIYSCTCYKLKEGDIRFDTIEELLFFIDKMAHKVNNNEV